VFGLRFNRLRDAGITLIACVFLAVATLPAQGNSEIVVSAAISLKNAFNEISAVYEKRYGVKVLLNLGSSGLLQKQIEAGAPVDVFASAGRYQMDALQGAGLIVDATRHSFTRNRLVLVVPSGSTLDLNSFSELVRPEVRKLAIGNPKTVPAGQYAEQVLRNLRIWESLEHRLVPAENVRQVLEYVSRGEVDAGIVYATDVSLSRGKASIAVSAPEDSHAPILYPVAVVKEAGSPQQARAFIDFTLSRHGQAIMEKYGFLSTR